MGFLQEESGGCGYAFMFVGHSGRVHESLAYFSVKIIVSYYFDILFKYAITLFSTRLNFIQVDDDVFPI